jgi:hypothetical protein
MPGDRHRATAGESLPKHRYFPAREAGSPAITTNLRISLKRSSLLGSRGRWHLTAAAALLVATLPLAGWAQSADTDEGADTHHDPPAVTVYSHAAPIARAIRAVQPIQIDGRLDEEIWRTAHAITEFVQTDPLEGQPPSEPTEVRIVYDDDAIYVGAILYDSEPVSTRLARRDSNVPSSDGFAILLDSYHDHQTAYRFAVNPSGVKRDVALSGGGGGDTSWDPVWEVATAIVPEGWVVEMRIPFSQLRFTRNESQVWGLQIERSIHRNQEDVVFAFTPRLERGGVARFGHLEGIEGIPAARRLELLPYVAARAEYRQIAGAAGVDFSNPFRSGSDYFGSTGLDLKYGITSNLTLDATVSPDFGQVEVDPAVINLTAFETRFDEKRPFFVEGAEIFRFGEGGPMGSTGRGPQLLYSRRIGRGPPTAVPGSPQAVYSDSPSASTILGAAKLTGKTSDGWSVGFLEAVTGRESARYVDALGGHHDMVVEPLTNYTVARVRRDFRNGQTRLGLIGTTVNRQLDEPLLESRLRSSAYSAGIDFSHEWADRSWRLLGAFTPSHVSGTADAILLTQRAAARYYQRPDADHLDLKPDATSLSGYYAMLDLNKQSGSFQAKVAVASASPGYEVNDLGFQTAADRIILDTNFSYIQPRPGRLFRRWDVRWSLPDAVWNHGGDRVMTELNAFGGVTFLNYWGMGWRLGFNPETANDRLTRGGPLSRDPRQFSGNFNISSDSRKNYVGRVSYQWSRDDGDSWSRSLNTNVSYRPGSSWEFRVGPSLDRSYNAAQYVTTEADPLAIHTFQRRYVFAGIDQTTLAIETRTNVTFTPNLSFELYAQPFFASGRYGPLKELRAPGVFDFLEYGSDIGSVERLDDGRFLIDPDGDPATANQFFVRDPDFSVRSLLGNAVLRWEWRPGSTLFLVWQQSRSERLFARESLAADRIGHFDLARDVRGLFDHRPENVFVVKMNYWLNP